MAASLPRICTCLVVFSLVPGVAWSAADNQALLQKRLEARVAALPVTAFYDQPYAGSTNDAQKLDLYLPNVRKTDGLLPVVVFIHGGGWSRGGRKNYASGVLPHAASGFYAGIAMSYRLSGEAKWPAQIHDSKAAIRWIRGNAGRFGLDPQRIAVWGNSAGGHLVSLLGTSGGVAELEGTLGPHLGESSRVACVVNQCGPQDLFMPFRVRNGQPVPEDEALLALFGGPFLTDRAKVIAASPVTYVTADDPPFLTFHATEDERVDFRHAERIHAALTAKGVSSILIPITHGRHHIDQPEVTSIIGEFFTRHLRGLRVEVPATPVQAPRRAEASAGNKPSPR
jgi:acetyl esterase/lipase